jgi:histidine phosphotransferase ChpT
MADEHAGEQARIEVGGIGHGRAAPAAGASAATAGAGAPTQNLSALVGSRICHDLVNPLGALGNGIELLSMEGAGGGAGLHSLLQESLAAATARLRFFRIAFGVAPGERIGRPDIVAIVQDFTAGRRLTVEWAAAGDRTRAEVKLAFLMILCFETAMPRGGMLRIEGEGSGRLAILARTAPADELRLEPALWGPLADLSALPALASDRVQFGLVHEMIAAGAARRIVLQRRQGGAIVTL